jgi:hypothetical protein
MPCGIYRHRLGNLKLPAACELLYVKFLRSKHFKLRYVTTTNQLHCGYSALLTPVWASGDSVSFTAVRTFC